MEAEQLQKVERLRRRDTKAYMAMILERKERDLRQVQNDIALPSLPPTADVHPTASIQRDRSDAPMIASENILRPPSTALDATIGSESTLNPPSIAGFDSPQGFSGTSRFSTLDLQNHVEGSVTLFQNRVSRLEEGLKGAIVNLFGNGPMDWSSANEGLIVPKAMYKATHESFEKIISRKCSENQYEYVPDSVRSLHASALQKYIIQKAKTMMEYVHLVSEVKRLLDMESIHPSILLDILGSQQGSANLDGPLHVLANGEVHLDETSSRQADLPDQSASSASPAIKRNLKSFEYEPGHINGVDGHKAESNGMPNGVKEKKRGRERSVSADDGPTSKKPKHAPQSTNNPFAETMEETFGRLLSREAARSAKMGVAT